MLSACVLSERARREEDDASTHLYILQLTRCVWEYSVRGEKFLGSEQVMVYLLPSGRGCAGLKGGP